MPIYEMNVPGAKQPRMIKAKDAAEALRFAKIVEIKPVNGERLLELQEAGVKLEKVPDPTDPASYAPGGPLHGQTPPAGVKVPEAGGDGKEG